MNFREFFFQAPSAGGDGQQAPGHPKPEAPVGRGAFLAGLMQQQQAQQPAGKLGYKKQWKGFSESNFNELGQF